jgi:hypothetical protein
MICSTTLTQKTVNLINKYKSKLKFISQAKNSSNNMEENQQQSDYENFDRSKKATTQT